MFNQGGKEVEVLRVVNAQMLFKAYEFGKSYDEVVEQATNIVAEGFENQPSFSVEDFSNYDVMKEKLAIQVVSTEMLEKIPHKEVEDMSMVCRFVVGNNENEMGTVLVTNQMLESYGITGEQLFNDAAKYAPKLRPSEIKGMADVLAEMMGVDVSELGETMGMPESPELPMYVASTHDKMNGAGIDNHKAYVQSWIEAVRDKPDSLIKAIKDAQSAANYMDLKAGLITEKGYEKVKDSVMEVKVGKSREMER